MDGLNPTMSTSSKSCKLYQLLPWWVLNAYKFGILLMAYYSDEHLVEDVVQLQAPLIVLDMFVKTPKDLHKYVCFCPKTQISHKLFCICIFILSSLVITAVRVPYLCQRREGADFFRIQS